MARIVLGLEEAGVAEEVMHFLDRTGRARVVATASDERQLAEAVRQLEPDAVVASPALVREGGLNGSVLLAVGTDESVRSLRGALRAGARGFFLWPADRDDLAGAAARAMAPPQVATRRGRVIAVIGSRGGAGATFVSTHLAAAFARRKVDCVLVDLDLVSGDATAAVGAPAGEEVRTVADLVPLTGELSSRHLDEVLWAHGAGFRVLLAPGGADAAAHVGAGDVRSTLEAVRGTADVVVVHLSRAVDPVARTALDLADRVVVVLRLDVASLRGATRAISATGTQERCAFVVNRASRSEIVPADVRRVFGRAAVAVIPEDRRVPQAQDHGRLLPIRGRTGRAVDRVARHLLEEPA